MISRRLSERLMYVNPIVSNAPFLCLLKTSENPTVFWCFQGAEKGCIENKWVKLIFLSEDKNYIKHLTRNPVIWKTPVRILTNQPKLWYEWSPLSLEKAEKSKQSLTETIFDLPKKTLEGGRKFVLIPPCSNSLNKNTSETFRL